MAKEDYKYLAVRNWGKYQQRMKNGEVRRPFVRDAAAKDSDPDYSGLTFYQRYLLDALRRLTALHGRNPHNDPSWVSRATCALPTDRPHVAYALHTLTTRGFLILTNEKDPFSQVLHQNPLNESKGNEVNEVPPSADSPSTEGRQSNPKSKSQPDTQSSAAAPCSHDWSPRGFCRKCESIQPGGPLDDSKAMAAGATSAYVIEED